MKQKKQYSKACIAALLLCFAVSGAYAQSVVIPNDPDSVWYSSHGTGATASPIQGINTAMISYGNVMMPIYIYASAYYDGSGTESIYVNDPFSSPSHISVASHGTLNGVPDLIIGNNSIHPQGMAAQYILATAFINSNSDVQIDFYDIVYSAASLSTFTWNSSQTIHVGGGTSGAAHNVHIDVIADAGNTIPTNFPFCDNFVVTYDDFTTGASPNVWAAYGNLNGYSVGASQQINPWGSSVYGHAPDVAAIRRNGFPNPSPIHDFALITYVDAANDKLYYSEWDITGAVTPTFSIYDNGSIVVNRISNPRIDARDDYNFNAPSNPYSVYKIAAQIDTNISGTHYQAVRTYDNLINFTASSPYAFPCSDVIDIGGTTGYGELAPYNDYAPTVALSGPIDYRVMHYMEYSAIPDSNIVFMEPINFSNPDEVVANLYYYWVNSQSTSGGTTPHTANAYGTYASAVSGPANNVFGINVVYAWAWYNSAVPDYEVSYKIPTTGVYQFKQGPAAVTNTTVNGWKVYPNPAANALVVNNTDAANAATEYHILDMEGRTVLQGSLQTGTTDIDVSMLAAGTYAIQVYKDGGVYGERLFVKN